MLLRDITQKRNNYCFSTVTDVHEKGKFNVKFNHVSKWKITKNILKKKKKYFYFHKIIHLKVRQRKKTG